MSIPLAKRTRKVVIETLELFYGMLSPYHQLYPSIIEADPKLQIGDYFNLKRYIRIEPSAPCTQSQNGGAERSEGVSKYKARSMRANGKLLANP